MKNKKDKIQKKICSSCGHDRDCHDFSHKGECRYKDCKCGEFFE